MTDYHADPSERLTMTFDHDDGDGFGLVRVVAATTGFRGAGEAWFDREQVTTFARSLSEYPLSSPLVLVGGYGPTAREIQDGLAQPGDLRYETVRLDVHPVGSKCQVGIAVHLATLPWPAGRPEAAYDVRLELLTTYERLRLFSNRLLAVVGGQLPAVCIGAERLT